MSEPTSSDAAARRREMERLARTKPERRLGRRIKAWIDRLLG